MISFFPFWAGGEQITDDLGPTIPFEAFATMMFVTQQNQNFIRNCILALLLLLFMLGCWGVRVNMHRSFVVVGVLPSRSPPCHTTLAIDACMHACTCDNDHAFKVHAVFKLPCEKENQVSV